MAQNSFSKSFICDSFILISLFALSGVCIDVSDPMFDQSWISEVPYVESITPTQLWNQLFNVSRPLKTSLGALYDIRERWTDSYLSATFGEELVRTEPDRENRTVDYCGLVRLGELVSCGPEDLGYFKELSVYYTLRDFLAKMTEMPETFGRYIITALPDSMAAELPFLPGFSCGLRRMYDPIDKPDDPLHATQVSELNFWMSKGSTYSVIHYDMNQQIMCQIAGRKEWRFWDLREELINIPMWSEFYPNTMSSDDSPIDPLDVDLEKYPDFIKARWTNTTLNPGECLLIPSRHALHFVRSFPGERNLGFSVHVSRNYENSSFYDCDDQVRNLTHSNLGKFDVMWPFPGDPRESGYKQVRMGFGDWKNMALYALKRSVVGASIQDSINELTTGRSIRSKRIAEFLEDLKNETDVLVAFRHGPLWREVLTLTRT